MSEEKNPPRAQIFRYFRIESRNNKDNSEEKNLNRVFSNRQIQPAGSVEQKWVQKHSIKLLICVNLKTTSDSDNSTDL